MIHPRQIDIVQDMFLPSSSELDRAQRMLRAFKEHAEKGIGACTVDGMMIDAPMIKWAEKIVQRASTH